LQPSCAAISVLDLPSAAANTTRQRNASACELFGRRAHRGAASRPADAAAHRRDTLDQWDQLGDVVAVAARDRPGERDSGRVDQEVVLGAVSGSINRARARRGAPFFACT